MSGMRIGPIVEHAGLVCILRPQRCLLLASCAAMDLAKPAD